MCIYIYIDSSNQTQVGGTTLYGPPGASSEPFELFHVPLMGSWGGLNRLVMSYPSDVVKKKINGSNHGETTSIHMVIYTMFPTMMVPPPSYKLVYKSH